jgi:MEMO1 family protein
MPDLLARLRPDLEIVPSPIAERPGLLVRDPFRFSDAAMVIPPQLVRALGCFDGLHTRVELAALLLRLTNRAFDVEQLVEGLSTGLSGAGFLDDEVFWQLRSDRHAGFARDPIRPAAFAGSGYPAEADALMQTLDAWLELPTSAATPNQVRRTANIGVAAPHASPSAGIDTYRAAYRSLGPVADDCTFVVLGTSHYGGLDRFGLTRKPFRTPLGEATTDVALVDELVRAVPGAVDVEDYCHAIEHSIEFQVVFLQRLFGPAVRILPILCGPFSCGVASHAAAADGAPDRKRVHLPERIASVRDTLGALAELHRRERGRLRWILGVDMAHMGPRYGDAEIVKAGDAVMTEVASLDQARLERIIAGDAEGFWNLAHQRGNDALKWCGSSPLYTFLRAVPEARGRVLHYDQWNIDDTSVVTFAALQFEI